MKNIKITVSEKQLTVFETFFGRENPVLFIFNEDDVADLPDFLSINFTQEQIQVLNDIGITNQFFKDLYANGDYENDYRVVCGVSYPTVEFRVEFICPEIE